MAPEGPDRQREREPVTVHGQIARYLSALPNNVGVSTSFGMVIVERQAQHGWRLTIRDGNDVPAHLFLNPDGTVESVYVDGCQSTISEFKSDLPAFSLERLLQSLRQWSPMPGGTDDVLSEYMSGIIGQDCRPKQASAEDAVSEIARMLGSMPDQTIFESDFGLVKVIACGEHGWELTLLNESPACYIDFCREGQLRLIRNDNKTLSLEEFRQLIPSFSIDRLLSALHAWSPDETQLRQCLRSLLRDGGFVKKLRDL